VPLPLPPVLVAPGVPALARPAEPAETALWQSLAEPMTVAALRRRGHGGDTIENFVTIGAAEAI
jgi:hypothetical protein